MTRTFERYKQKRQSVNNFIFPRSPPGIRTQRGACQVRWTEKQRGSHFPGKMQLSDSSVVLGTQTSLEINWETDLKSTAERSLNCDVFVQAECFTRHCCVGSFFPVVQGWLRRRGQPSLHPPSRSAQSKTRN
eukprot:2471362-Rhodomonas_salina.2